MFRRTVLFGLAIVASLSACRPTVPHARYVTPWMGLPHQAIRDAHRPPREGTRATAYLAVAMYEAFAADPASGVNSLGGQLNGLWSLPVPPEGGVDGAIAAAAAARMVLAHFVSGSKVLADSISAAQLAARSREHVGEPLRVNSTRFGHDLAQALLTWADADGLATLRRRAGLRRPPTEITDADWATLRTFVVRTADECVATPAPAYSTRPNSEFWKMAKESYDSARAAPSDALEVARFWAEDSRAGGTLGARWTKILETVAKSRGGSAAATAEAFLLASLAMADAEVTVLRQGQRERVVSPALYVKRAINAQWTPLASPREPVYPSGPAAVAGAVSEVLARLFGDTTAFTDSAGPVARSVPGFGRARDEVATAGVHMGLHYFPSVRQGLWQGQCVADRVLGRLKTRG